MKAGAKFELNSDSITTNFNPFIFLPKHLTSIIIGKLFYEGEMRWGGGGLARYCFLKYISCCEVILFFAVCKQPGTEEYGLKLINFPIISFEEDTIPYMGIYVCTFCRSDVGL